MLTHLPVMPCEVLAALEPSEGKVFVDGTLGGAGHTRLLLLAGAAVIGIDQDPFALQRAKQAGLERLEVRAGNFREMATLVQQPVDGVLLDLGVSSFQLDDKTRGFSFHEDAPLDMRMSQHGESAADVVNTLEVEDLARIIFEYGEERHSRRIARAIVEEREKTPFVSTVQLANTIKRAYPGQHARGIHPARRTFQALRIYVNDELGALKDGLSAAKQILKQGGRLAVISFHSLEDRIVKQFTRNQMQPIYKKPIEASEEEIAKNPRSRSAKLRVALKADSSVQS
ncbi:MAG: 16S rRNA (cytosine(1402)-N(4))-methyltransferase RsmH [Deinococcales bacterium]